MIISMIYLKKRFIKTGVNDMTNAELFKKVFGFTPDGCPAPAKVCKLQIADCKKCPFNNWWKKLYMPCFELKEEFEDERP